MKKKVSILIKVLCGCIGVVFMIFTLKKKLSKENELNEKNNAVLEIYCHWLGLKQEGLSLEDYFKKNNFQKIAVYGMHFLGESLCKELEETSIEVCYAIDRNADSIYSDVQIVKPSEVLRDVDAIIVTAFYYFDEIEADLRNKVSCPIISIEDVLYEV